MDYGLQNVGGYVGILNAPVITVDNADSAANSATISAIAESYVNSEIVHYAEMYGCIEDPATHEHYATIWDEFYTRDIAECNGHCVAVGERAFSNPQNKNLGTICCFDYYSDDKRTVKIDAFIKSVDSSTANARTNTIASVDITAPYAKKTPKTIRVGYHQRSWSDIDYYYDDVKPVGTTIAAMLPINGKIKFQDRYTPIGLYVDSAPEIHMTFAGSNSISYNHDKNEIASFFKISGQEVSFDFSDNWFSTFPTNRLSSGGNVLLLCKFRYKVKDTQDSSKNIIAQPISICSSTSAAPEQCYHSATADVYVPVVQFFWGCFGKDTMILMADNTQKKISDIQPGEQVFVFNGEPCAVKEVTGGTEDIMLRIETENDKHILLTQTHPVLTARGPVQAHNLDINDIIIMQDGIGSPIRYMYSVDYYDNIYNLDLGSANLVVANGFVAGDHYCQNSKIEETAIQEPLSSEAEKLFAEMKLLRTELKKL